MLKLKHYLVFFSLLLLFSCQKEDPLIKEYSGNKNFIEKNDKTSLITISDWSLEEVKFFSIDNNTTASQANTRSAKNLAVHPSLIEVYNTLAAEEQRR